MSMEDGTINKENTSTQMAYPASLQSIAIWILKIIKAMKKSKYTSKFNKKLANEKLDVIRNLADKLNGYSS